MMNPNHPRVTLALIAYNQEKYIRDAIACALAQNYSPLQIIFSDDCSEDKTFQIIQEELYCYNGPHDILLNKNNCNLGIGAHINLIMTLSDGDYVVAAAGDDKSAPNRVSRIVDYFSSNPDCYSVYSNMKIIDSNNVAYNDWVDGAFEHVNKDLLNLCLHGTHVFGCTQGWSRVLFDVFGPIEDGVLHEDHVIPFRASLLGKVLFINEVLVLYRRHENNIFKENSEILINKSVYESRRKFRAPSIVCELSTMLKDLKIFIKINSLESEIYKRELSILKRRLATATLDCELLYSESLIKKIKILGKSIFIVKDIVPLIYIIINNFMPSLVIWKAKLSTYLRIKWPHTWYLVKKIMH